ncbi:MAG: long-chain fatty acid transporter [Betaproteobacteria bacterium HGW-Betaproteobacteria-18]|nr:MAG: long-chain fatty acid transporter [Gammaproteobacteria bacterium HGW-Gammaproteobacteria-2]PKO59539.1 MAG: long-chain fatty acid transporter [Betaproteobacteria bacterium HGW-Betaproteobacteria-18]
MPLSTQLPTHTPRRHALTLSLLSALSMALPVQATNGYFAHGYGVKSQGMAGVGYALPQDGLASAFNPAGIAELDDRFDLGATGFFPRRSADIQGNAFGPDAHFEGDGRKTFVIPEFAWVHRLSPRWSTGLAVYGNGGLNTQFKDNPFARFGGSGEAGVNLEQLFITPSLAYRIGENHRFGAALNIAYQRFYARGLGLFAGFSQAPDNVSNKGTDSSVGVGLRLGWSSTLAPGLTLGASWASKIDGRFDKYRGLFADNGGFDIPENYGAGIAYKPSDAWTLAADVQRIRYSQTGSVGNSLAPLLQGVPLGADNGPGFGWRSATTYKFGLSHALSQRLTVRAGYSHVDQPIPANETFFNILAPGVVEDHLTAGFTFTLRDGDEFSAFVTHGFGKTVNGRNSIPAGFPPGGFGGGEANIRLRENIVGIAYAWKL